MARPSRTPMEVVVIRHRLTQLAVPSLLLALPLAIPVGLAATAAPAAAQSGVGNIPQGTQSNTSYTGSFAASNVTNTDATSGPVSCYRPDDPYFVSDCPNDCDTGMLA